MLLWEMLAAGARSGGGSAEGKGALPAQKPRLPFDTRCAAITRSGKRCRGKIREGCEWCVFHDPAIAERRRARPVRPRNARLHRLKHLPDGYLRSLTTRQAVGQAMDRLYREVRLGVITPRMGEVLFGVLCRLLDSGLADGRNKPKAPHRSRAERLRPRMRELLTQAERLAWRKAVAQAPPEINGELSPQAAGFSPRPARPRRVVTRPADQPAALPFPVPQPAATLPDRQPGPRLASGS